MLAAERRAAVREARMAEERRRLHEAQLAAKALLVRVRVRDPNPNHTVTLTRRVYGPAEECINSAGRFLLRTNGFVRAEDIAWAMT